VQPHSELKRELEATASHGFFTVGNHEAYVLTIDRVHFLHVNWSSNGALKFRNSGGNEPAPATRTGQITRRRGAGIAASKHPIQLLFEPCSQRYWVVQGHDQNRFDCR
jgi:hypothetical protein